MPDKNTYSKLAEALADVIVKAVPDPNDQRFRMAKHTLASVIEEYTEELIDDILTALSRPRTSHVDPRE